MNTLIKCPDCGKLVAVNFPVHQCDLSEHRKPQPMRLLVPQVYEITRKTKRSVRIKPYGSTNRAAVRNFTREDFDRLYIDRGDHTAVRRDFGKPLGEVLKD